LLLIFISCVAFYLTIFSFSFFPGAVFSCIETVSMTNKNKFTLNIMSKSIANSLFRCANPSEEFTENISSEISPSHIDAFSNLASNHRTLFPYHRTFSKRTNATPKELNFNNWKNSVETLFSAPNSNNNTSNINSNMNSTINSNLSYSHSGSDRDREKEKEDDNKLFGNFAGRSSDSNNNNNNNYNYNSHSTSNSSNNIKSEIRNAFASKSKDNYNQNNNNNDNIKNEITVLKRYNSVEDLSKLDAKSDIKNSPSESSFDQNGLNSVGKKGSGAFSRSSPEYGNKPVGEIFLDEKPRIGNNSNNNNINNFNNNSNQSIPTQSQEEKNRDDRNKLLLSRRGSLTSLNSFDENSDSDQEDVKNIPRIITDSPPVAAPSNLLNNSFSKYLSFSDFALFYLFTVEFQFYLFYLLLFFISSYYLISYDIYIYITI
jgi:hypothetical protein